MSWLKRARWVKPLCIVLTAILGMHKLLDFKHEPTKVLPTASLSNLTLSWGSYFAVSDMSESPPVERRANATLVMLARNTEIEEVAYSMKQMEDRFNKKFNYPWVFLNDEPFTEEFINRTAILTNANTSYGLIPREQWGQPEWIDESKAKGYRRILMAYHVIYANSVSYRNMCRFNSGFFYRHEFLQKYKYYWRVEPDVRFYCDLDYDPFLKMEDEGKVYGFNMAMLEFEKTIPTLWNTVKEFTQLYPETLHPDNALGFLSNDEGKTYNLCHFWSNFEIADMEFWRGETYSKFFDHLDRSGGFYYERWGDAPVHSIAASLFLPKQKLHFFSDIGYKHSIFQHCPQGGEHKRGKCWCNHKDNFDYQEYSCLRKYDRLFNTSNPDDMYSDTGKLPGQ